MFKESASIPKLPYSIEGNNKILLIKMIVEEQDNKKQWRVITEKNEKSSKYKNIPVTRVYFPPKVTFTHLILR